MSRRGIIHGFDQGGERVVVVVVVEGEEIEISCVRALLLLLLLFCRYSLVLLLQPRVFMSKKGGRGWGK